MRSEGDHVTVDAVQAAWKLSKHTFDKDFQLFMDGKILEIVARGSPEASPGQ
jgi:hypothetical protein